MVNNCSFYQKPNSVQTAKVTVNKAIVKAASDVLKLVMRIGALITKNTEHKLSLQQPACI